MITLSLSGLAVAAAEADDTKCRVMDPTGTPLNVRTAPSGRIIGNMPNDMLVAVIDRAVDRTGKAWVYISKFSDGKPMAGCTGSLYPAPNSRPIAVELDQRPAYSHYLRKPP
jgi:hypothetical protein